MNVEALKQYFETRPGTGVLATSGSAGDVDVAVYAKPRFLDDGSVVFVMLDRLTRLNTQSNPHAAYLFMEGGDQNLGKRLFLTKIREEAYTGGEPPSDRREFDPADYEGEKQYLVYFQLDKVLPLVMERTAT